MSRSTFLLLSVFIFCLFSPVLSVFNQVVPEEYEEYMNFMQMTMYHGYPVQTFHLETADGYLLCLHRIPGGRNTTVEQEVLKPKQPVLMLHDITGSSMDFIINGPVISPAYMLADEGSYDVWLINFRGNTYSRYHAFLDPDMDRAFWDFSFEEMAEFDLKAATNFILEKTGHTKLSLVGYSVGSAVAFYALSNEKTFFENKIDIAVALAPLATLINSTHYYLHDMAGSETFSWYLMHNNFYEAMYNNGGYQSNELFKGVFSGFCISFPRLCTSTLNFASDLNDELVNMERLAIYNSHASQGVSLKQLVHFSQILSSQQFQKFSYKPDQNLQYYGTLQPPIIDLSKISTPVALFVGKQDTFASVKDGRQIFADLGGAVVKYEELELDHLSFVLGRNMSYFEDVKAVLGKH